MGMYSLIFMRNIAGMPSGPAAEFFFRFWIAFDIYSLLNIISDMSSSSILFNSSFVAFIASFVSLNCELYCSISILHISLMNGPIFESLFHCVFLLISVFFQFYFSFQNDILFRFFFVI